MRRASDSARAGARVDYGGARDARAVSQLRAVMAYLQVATVQNQVQLSLMTDFENFNVFKPAEHFPPDQGTRIAEPEGGRRCAYPTTLPTRDRGIVAGQLLRLPNLNLPVPTD